MRLTVRILGIPVLSIDREDETPPGPAGDCITYPVGFARHDPPDEHTPPEHITY